MRFFSPDKQNEFFKFVGDHHHVAAEGIDQFARGIGVELNALRIGGIDGPLHGVALIDTRKLQHGAMFAQCFADAFVAVFVLQLHAAHIGRNTDVVGHKNDQRIRIGVLEIVFDGGELVVVLAAGVEVLHTADEEHLERRHQRRCAGAVERMLQLNFAEVHVVHAQFANVGRDQLLQDGIAAALAKERLVAHKHISRRQLAGLHIGHEPVRGGEAAH